MICKNLRIKTIIIIIISFHFMVIYFLIQNIEIKYSSCKYFLPTAVKPDLVFGLKSSSSSSKSLTLA